MQSPDLTSSSATRYFTQKRAIVLKPGDLVLVEISNPDPSISMEFFQVGGGKPEITDNLLPYAYPIDENGSVYLPVVGAVKVGGLSLFKARETVEKAIERYVKNAVVNLKLASFTVTVLGAVNQQGTFPVNRHQLNLLEALGMAGGLSAKADPAAITLVRNTDKSSEVILFDLKDPGFMRSEFFFLHPGDVIYIPFQN